MLVVLWQGKSHENKWIEMGKKLFIRSTMLSSSDTEFPPVRHLHRIGNFDLQNCICCSNNEQMWIMILFSDICSIEILTWRMENCTFSRQEHQICMLWDVRWLWQWLWTILLSLNYLQGYLEMEVVHPSENSVKYSSVYMVSYITRQCSSFAYYNHLSPNWHSSNGIGSCSEVPSLNHSWDISYAEWGFLSFTSVPQQIAGILLQLSHDNLLPDLPKLSSICRFISVHLTLYSWATQSIVK